ncbi:Rv3654c family TadE-like protein [Amycolatopsis sp. NPDC006131]|uniref:Rv3654c family TadE-like protein n=1 Tax=Amycolatopsis sp. NPDC006131 TaxID=3156731 RepID=UPI0033B53465
MPLPDLMRPRGPVSFGPGVVAVQRPTRLRAGPAQVGDPHGRDRGAATVWAACAIAGLVVFAGLLWGLGTAAIARHRAAGAADLAALAAAGRAADGTEVACGQALWVAERMGARVVRCRFEGWDALVEVVVDTGLGPAAGRARAGP